MKFLPFFILIIIFCSCGSEETKKIDDVPWVSEVLVQPKTCDHFLKMFKPFSGDTFKIESPEQDDDLNDDVFFGTELDSSFYSFLDKGIVERMVGDYKVFACFKRKISETQYLLILRTPGEYWESTIELFVFDSLLHKNPAHLEVAESWGDAGDSMSKISYLLNSKGKYSIVLFRNDCSYIDDEYTVQECTDSVSFFNINEKISFEKGELHDSTAVYNHLF